MENLFLEKTENIKKFLNRMDKSFENAKTCRKCYESCGDIFYNSYKNILRDLENLEKEVLELSRLEEKSEVLLDTKEAFKEDKSFDIEDTRDEFEVNFEENAKKLFME